MSDDLVATRDAQLVFVTQLVSTNDHGRYQSEEMNQIIIRIKVKENLRKNDN